MEMSVRRVVRVLSNNAVLTRDGDNEMVLVGRGIGFGRREGDVIDEQPHQQRYVELDPERVQMLNWVSALGDNSAEIIGQAVDLAADSLGSLHPAVYVLLMDHLAFAVQRTNSGETIENPLVPQIKEMFPQELDTARQVVRFLNQHLAIDLPEDEAGFIALHLNAARSGENVKQPLQRANKVASLVGDVRRLLGRPESGGHDDITRDVVLVNRRLHVGKPRRNDASHSVRRDLAQDFAIASRIICQLLDATTLPKDLEGEATYLAMQVHGWRMDTEPISRNRKERA